MLLLRHHSTTSQADRILPPGGLTRHQARRVLDYIESNLDGQHAREVVQAQVCDSRQLGQCQCSNEP
jgi:hypothetical protein